MNPFRTVVCSVSRAMDERAKSDVEKSETKPFKTGRVKRDGKIRTRGTDTGKNEQLKNSRSAEKI